MYPEQPSTAGEQALQEVETSPLAADSLVEEISIDGMCGVY
jgi:mycofactocin precursor